MKAENISSDVSARNSIERKERIKRAKRVNEVEKKQPVSSTGYYESRGMTKQDKEITATITPQEAFRREVARNSQIREKLFKNTHEEKKEEKIEETEEDIGHDEK